MNIQDLTVSEKLDLLKQLEQHFGWNPVAAVCVQDVSDHLENLDVDVKPTDEHIAQACRYVARKADIDVSHLIDWAADVAQELAEQGATA